MKNIHSIEFYTGSKEELLPDFEKDYLHEQDGIHYKQLHQRQRRAAFCKPAGCRGWS